VEIVGRRIQEAEVNIHTRLPKALTTGYSGGENERNAVQSRGTAFSEQKIPGFFLHGEGIHSIPDVHAISIARLLQLKRAMPISSHWTCG